MFWKDGKILAAIQHDAIARYPNESCGAITPDGYVSLPNLSVVPRMAFDCRVACERLALDGQLLAVVHSHPDGPEGPSSPDMRQQAAMDIPWGLVMTDGRRVNVPFFWGPGVPIPPLLQRPFRHGPSGSDGKGDCYALIKDWWKLERDIDLPEFPRTDDWWKHKDHPEGNLYRDNFAAAGFVELPLAEGLADPQVGDVWLARIRSPVPNHGGVYVGEGLTVHHVGGCLSTKDVLNRHRRLISTWLRRTV
jgi:proteasome lid subunit RPN8/RPN11